MSKRQRGRKGGKRTAQETAERRAKVAAKRAAATVATVEDLAAELGIGLNQAYALVQMKVIPAMRVGRRWLIPRAAIAKLASGEIMPQITPEAAKQWREREAAATATVA